MSLIRDGQLCGGCFGTDDMVQPCRVSVQAPPSPEHLADLLLLLPLSIPFLPIFSAWACFLFV